MTVGSLSAQVHASVALIFYLFYSEHGFLGEENTQKAWGVAL